MEDTYNPPWLRPWRVICFRLPVNVRNLAAWKLVTIIMTLNIIISALFGAEILYDGIAAPYSLSHRVNPYTGKILASVGVVNALAVYDIFIILAINIVKASDHCVILLVSFSLL